MGNYRGFGDGLDESLTLHRFGKQSLRAEYWDPAAARKAIGRLKFKVRGREPVSRKSQTWVLFHPPRLEGRRRADLHMNDRTGRSALKSC